DVVLVGQAQDAQGVFYAAVWRLTSSGALDGSFNGRGRTVFRQIAGTNPTDPAQGLDYASGVAVDAQNGIVFAGTSSIAPTGFSPPAQSRAFVGRLLPSGALDTSFGNGGFIVLPPPPTSATWAYSLANGVAIDSQGRIVVAGEVGIQGALGMGAWRL